MARETESFLTILSMGKHQLPACVLAAISVDLPVSSRIQAREMENMAHHGRLERLQSLEDGISDRD